MGELVFERILQRMLHFDEERKKSALNTSEGGDFIEETEAEFELDNDTEDNMVDEDEEKKEDEEMEEEEEEEDGEEEEEREEDGAEEEEEEGEDEEIVEDEEKEEKTMRKMMKRILIKLSLIYALKRKKN